MNFPNEIETWLKTIPYSRREWFIRYVKQEPFLSFSDGYSETELYKVLNEKKEQVIKYMNEKDLNTRKHWSKGKKHKERGEKYDSVEQKFYKYWVDYIKLFKDVFDVDLVEKWDGYLWLCPFHKENTPSLSISPLKSAVKCYGCGVWGWNVISFLLNKFDSLDKVFGIINEYILSKDESKKFFAYWKEKDKSRIKSTFSENEKNILDVNNENNQNIDYWDLPF